MKCPYCNEEMENGYLKSNHTIRWGKDIEMGLITDDIRVNKFNWREIFGGCVVDTYYCKDCKKMIVPLE